MSTSPENRNIEQLLGEFSGEVLEHITLDDMRCAYRELLEADGITFPDAALEKYLVQREARAAYDRGAYYLAEDGSPVDMQDFDPNSQITRDSLQRQSIDNSRKLNSLVQLSLLSKSGAVAEAVVREAVDLGMDGSVAPFQYLIQSYKHYVQLSMATEQWAMPWQDFVKDNFEQEGLSFPLDKDGVSRGLGIMSHPLYRNVQLTHFVESRMIQHNMFARLEESIGSPTDIMERNIGYVALIGMFYVHSPEGSIELIKEHIERRELPDTVAWVEEVQRAVAFTQRRS